MLKQLLASSVVQFLIGRAIGGYMLLVGITTRWTRVNRQAVEPFWQGNGRVVVCVWHGRFMQVHRTWAFGPGMTKARMLISQSREGGVVAHASRTVGAEVIRGSAARGGRQKGGVEAMRAMARHLDGGGAICMTPDGPRGPRMRAKRGPVQLAKLACAPLMGVAWATSNRMVFDSWDRFILPLPFGRGALVWSDPIAPPPLDADEAQVEAVRLNLEAAMNRIALEADRIAGVEPIQAAALDPGGIDDAEPAAQAS